MTEPESVQRLVMVLERVVTGVTPDYVTVGYTVCPLCEHMVWVDQACAERLIADESIWPICLTCAEKSAAETPEYWTDENKVE